MSKIHFICMYLAITMTIQFRPSPKREKLHPTITETQISELVDQFYSAIQANSQLGPIFETHIGGNWDRHLDKMKSFWRSVLLRTGEYKGKPVIAHAPIDDLGTPQFQEWLRLFSSVSKEIFHPDAVGLVDQAAHRIATSLWLSKSQDPFASPPKWND